MAVPKKRNGCPKKELEHSSDNIDGTVSGAHLPGGSRGSGPLPFFDTFQIVPSNSSTNLEEML